ncbi:Hypothetical predicted protein, partial [Paramuricea clavata]
KVAEQLLNEQADAFAQSDDDVGSIPNLQLKIHLNDKTPVQKNYVAVPRPLYPEVKAYVEDLLNRKFIRRSNSSYTVPLKWAFEIRIKVYDCASTIASSTENQG